MDVFDLKGDRIGRCDDLVGLQPPHYWQVPAREPGFLHVPVQESINEYRSERYRLGLQRVPCVLLADGQDPKHLPGFKPLDPAA